METVDQDEAGSSLKARLVNMARKTLQLEEKPENDDSLDKLLGKFDLNLQSCLMRCLATLDTYLLFRETRLVRRNEKFCFQKMEQIWGLCDSMSWTTLVRQCLFQVLHRS